MDKTFTYLVPTIDNTSESFKLAISSITSDGWNVEYLVDVDRNGPGCTKNILSNNAIKDTDVEFIRFADDDILLPHRLNVLEAFTNNPEIDVVCLNYDMKLPSGTIHHIECSGDPIQDTMIVGPWNWVIRKSALCKIIDTYGNVWNNFNYREGGYLWLRFIRLGLKIHYLGISSYRYTKSFSMNNRSNHPEFYLAGDALLEEVKSLSKNAQ